jgi:hypothetical protein
VLTEALRPNALPHGLHAHGHTLLELGQVYKQIMAPFGPLAHDTLVASTVGISSGSSADDSTYLDIEQKIESLTARRDAVAAQMRTALWSAAFTGAKQNQQQLKSLIAQGKQLLADAAALAGGP